MKKITFLKVLAFGAALFTSSIINAQAPDWTWVKQTTNSKVFPTTMTVDNNGNSIVAGYFEGATITFDGTVLSDQGGTRFYITKYDTNGNVLWAKSAYGVESHIRDITSDADGNIYALGINTGDLTIDNITLAQPELVSTCFLLKFSPDGTALFGKRFSNAFMQAITVNNNTIYLEGTYVSNSITIDGITFPVPQEFANILVLKCNIDTGVVTWGDAISGSMLSSVGIIADSEGNYYISGLYNEITLGDDTYETNGYGDSFIAKFNNDNELLWSNNYSVTPTGDQIFDFSLDESGNLYASFNSWISQTNSDSAIVKYSPEGELLWTKNITGEGKEANPRIATDLDGNIYTTGFSNSPDLSISEAAQQLETSVIYVSKLNTEGEFQWIKTAEAGNSVNNQPRSICLDPAFNIYVYGGFFNTLQVGETLLDTPPAFFELFLTKLGDEQINGVDDFAYPEYSLYPNPAQDVVHIHTEKINSKYNIIDVTGRIVKTGKTENSTIEVYGLPSGLYILKTDSGINAKFIKE